MTSSPALYREILVQSLNPFNVLTIEDLKDLRGDGRIELPNDRDKGYHKCSE
jgi:hypothetical protein